METFIPKILLRIEIYSFDFSKNPSCPRWRLSFQKSCSGKKSIALALVRIQAFVDGYFLPKILLRKEIYSFGFSKKPSFRRWRLSFQKSCSGKKSIALALVRMQTFVDGDFHSKNLAPERHL